MKRILGPAVGIALFAAGSAAAATVTVPMTLISADGIGKAIGSVTLRDSKYGLVIEPKLSGLPAGWRGMHVHQNPSCAPGDQNGKAAAGFAAGGHLDPAATGVHRGPLDKTGHLGDLPFLTVDRDGTATALALAPRLKVRDVAGRALMIHAGGDNYSDQPEPLGGGGGRIACGVIPGKAAAPKKATAHQH